MVLMTYHNPLEGISFRVVGVAKDAEVAKKVLQHYYSGMNRIWEEQLTAETHTLIRWIDTAAGICYIIREVEVYR